MRRTLTLILGVALIGILAAVAVASQGAEDPAGAGTTTAETTTDRTTTVEDNPERVGDDDGRAGIDISGPCDEAEHANDPRCTGQAPAAGSQAPAAGVDISGPCDEAEHANDPRCAGAAVGDDDRHGDGDDDNSGPGSASSGPGGGDDDSGRGRGRGRGGDSG
ncbi:MAG TPA: hypothetical protein VFM57_02295 [Thermoleophilaceae bacterium]|nr:hypothetical protein [Thermoleophilaceae bacterium]